MIATINRLVVDPDDTMDVFSSVCEALSANDFSKLRAYSAQLGTRASVATWLVAVVRNSTIDWLRHRDGRKRSSVPAGLSPLQQQIHFALCAEAQTHAEAFEHIRSRHGLSLSFHKFLREVRITNRIAPCPSVVRSLHPTHVPLTDAMGEVEINLVELAEREQRVAKALSTQPVDVRLAVELFVVDRVSAESVARIVGWPNAKTVYNRVYRSLSALRIELGRSGIGPRDL